MKSASPFTYAYPPLDSGTRYAVSVEGCRYVGASGRSCTNQWVQANVTTQAALPVTANPPVKATSKQCELKPFSAGGCSLVNGKIRFQSDGDFLFSAQLRTARTTTSDYWHVAFNLLDISGHSLGSISGFTGPAMKDAHPGYYNWSHNGTYAAGVYPSLASVRMPGRC